MKMKNFSRLYSRGIMKDCTKTTKIMISVGLHNLPDEIYSGSRVRDYEIYGEDFGVGIYLNE
jgi:hypothetical protein